MDVNGYSAYIMDLLVKRINEYKSTLDYNVALKEYALSTLTETRNLTLGYGCANIEQSLSSNINQTMILGKGYASGDNGSNYSIINSTELGIDLFSQLNTGAIYYNCYAFGTVYLTSYFNTVRVFNITSNLTRGGTTNSGDPLLISKDISLDDALNLHVPDAPTPTNTGPYAEFYSIPIFRFVIDINEYNGDILTSSYNVYIKDIRKQRGVFGFSDEDLAFKMTPLIIRAESLTLEQYNTLYDNIKTIVREWVLLPDWNPTFSQYWQTSSYELPTDLRNFIINDLNMVI